MSSILEALRELETRRPSVPRPRIPFEEPPARALPIAAGLAVLALLGGGGAYFWPRAKPATHVAQAPAVAPATSAAAIPATPPAVAPPAMLDAEPPPAPPALGAQLPHAEVVAAAPAAPSVVPNHVPPRPAQREPRRARVAAARAEPPAPVARRAAPPRRVGEPRVEVSSIDYGTSGEPTATLRINSGNPVVVHEGETVDAVDIQLILPDRVYLHHSGQIFAVEGP